MAHIPNDFSAGSADAEQRAAVKGDGRAMLASQVYDLSLELASGHFGTKSEALKKMWKCGGNFPLFWLFQMP